jgi:OOP family OmpA-OmpF porin
MRPRIAAFAFTCALSWSARSVSARADECAGPVSPCINDDTLWPHAGPATFASVGSTDILAAGQLGFGLVTSYLSRPIVIQVPAPGAGGSSQYAVNDQVNGTFLWSYGASDRLELDLALPLTFGQGGTGLQPITGGADLHDTAERDLRFGLAYALVPHLRIDPDVSGESVAGRPVRPNTFGLVARFEVSAPTGDHDQFASDGAAVFVPSVAADLRHDRWSIGVEIGGRIRPITQLLGARVGTQIVAEAGVGYDLLPRQLLTATLEAWALPTLVGQGAGAADPLVPAEWALSARSAPLHGGDLAIQLGGGSAIPFGGVNGELTTPRFRFTLGIRWAPLARDTDGDGVVDATDRCPRTPAPGTPDGCPVADSPNPQEGP